MRSSVESSSVLFFKHIVAWNEFNSTSDERVSVERLRVFASVETSTCVEREKKLRQRLFFSHERDEKARASERALQYIICVRSWSLGYSLQIIKRVSERAREESEKKWKKSLLSEKRSDLVFSRLRKFTQVNHTKQRKQNDNSKSNTNLDAES